MIINRRVVGGGSTPRLPAEYQEAEYIYGEDGAYIDSNYFINSSTNRFNIECALPIDAYSNMVVFGCEAEQKRLFWRCVLVNKYSIYTDKGQPATTQFFVPYGDKYIYSVYADATVFCNGVKLNEGNNVINGINGLSVFFNGLNYNGTNASDSYGKITIYNIKIYEETLVANFIPCYKKDSYLPGLYDVVRGTFHAGLGGLFAVGPNVN